MFPSFLILRYKYPYVPRTYRVPGGMLGAWIVTVFPFAYALVAVIFLLVPSTRSKVDRLTYELTQFIPLAIIVMLTIVFYVMGHSDKRNQDVVVELSTVESEVGPVGGVA